MPSAIGLLLAATMATVPFGAPLEVRLDTNPEGLEAGAVVGDLLVVTPPRPAPGGGALVTVRPLALGAVPVLLPGGPQPSVIEVGATLATGVAPAPPRFPSPPHLPWWPAAVLLAAATVAVLLWRRRAPRGPSPLAELQRALAPLTEACAWESPHAADVLAREARRFLALALAAPYRAMTTYEATEDLRGRLQGRLGLTFGAAFSLADALRFAARDVRAEDAAGLVNEVIAAAEELAAAGARQR